MARNDQVIRQIIILQILANNTEGLKVDEVWKRLPEDYRVSKRTVYRDLQSLEAAGFPLENSDGKWKIIEESKKYAPPLPFTFDELSALYITKNFLKPLDTTPFAHIYKTIYKKIISVLPKRSMEYLHKLENTFSVSFVGTKDYSRSHGVIKKLIYAIMEKRKVSIFYYSFLHEWFKEYFVLPLHIVYSAGGLYLISYSYDAKEFRTFAIERIQELTVTNEVSKEEIEFCPDDFLNSTFGIYSEGKKVDIQVWFHPSQTKYITERVWHSTQKVERLKDGSCILTLCLNSEFEFLRWLSAFGPKAKILEPKWLIEKFKKHLEETKKVYSSL
ncbi:MAG: hypothetical protein DRG20_00155 [Deltaproteobacteria bacterium]|nr:WYL domain-containing transcriptional regulator [Deltaproteobacteria bacterium]RLA91826.1 MAG: hypothetical protein DRG20_00155 [Deltaproteobacteria bacterium]